MDERTGLIMDLVLHSCLGEDEITVDNMCLDVYEMACNYLCGEGLLEKVNDRIYHVKKGCLWRLSFCEKQKKDVGRKGDV